MLIDKPFSMTNKIWNLTNEIHLTLTEWKPIPYIFPIRTTVHIGQRTKRIGSPRTRKLAKKILKKTKKRGKKQKKFGAGDCCDAAQTDKASGRVCGRGCSRQKGQGDPACGWVICE
jgi:hypothetical protein